MTKARVMSEQRQEKVNQKHFKRQAGPCERHTLKAQEAVFSQIYKKLLSGNQGQGWGCR
jgi:hypothetical protein